MRAMLLHRPVRLVENPFPLEVADLPIPAPGEKDLLVRVSVCGICRTDLDIAEGRVAATHYPVVPGHQIVGRVERTGTDVNAFREGDRVGVAWINWADGVCGWCQSGRENLCPQFRSTGANVDGGYAEYVVVPAAFAHAIPAPLNDAEAAPLLCAGAIGWRSLCHAELNDGDRLGLTGFGASAHLVLQIARKRYPNSPVYVFARNPEERSFALELGALWSGDTSDDSPEQLDAIIDTTPAWKPVVEGLRHLAPGGRLVINAISKSTRDQNELLQLNYTTHLWMEREIKSVANVTRNDVREMLELAATTGLRPTTEMMPLEEANRALTRLSEGARLRGAMVLDVTATSR